MDGTLQDWEALRTKTAALASLGKLRHYLGEWLKDVDDIL